MRLTGNHNDSARPAAGVPGRAETSSSEGGSPPPQAPTPVRDARTAAHRVRSHTDVGSRTQAPGRGARGGPRAAPLRMVESTARPLGPDHGPRGAKGTFHGMSDSGRVAKENHAARGFTIDPRVLELAEEAARNIEGGRAAMLTPEKRRKVMSLATKLGVRTFDASLVIAIAQDRARQGVRAENERAGDDVRLGLMGPAQRERDAGVLRLVMCGIAVALSVFGALVAWVLK